MDYPLLVLLIIIALVPRLVIPIVRKEFGSDAYYHLMVARRIRRTGHVPKTDDFLWPERRHTYPPLLHLMITPFEFKAEAAAKRCLSVFIDLLAVVLLFATSEWLGLSHPYWPPLIYALSPMNVLDASSLNPRPLGNLLLCGAFASAWYLPTAEDTSMPALALVAVVLLESGIMIGHKLSMQALIPIHVLVTVAAFLSSALSGVLVLLAFPAAIVVSTGITKGAYLRSILPDHIKYIRVHMKRGEYRTGEISLPSPTRLLKANPISVIAPFAGLYVFLAGHSIEGQEYLLPWSFVVLGLAVMWVWGDGFRYLQFGTFPGAIILGSAPFLIVDETASMLLLGGFGVFLATVTALQIRRSRKGDAASQVVAAYNSLPSEWREKLRNSVVYANYPHYAIPYVSDAKVLVGNPSSDGVEFNFKVNQLAKLPLKRVTEYVKAEFGRDLDFILVFKKFGQPDSNGLTRVYDNESIAVFTA